MTQETTITMDVNLKEVTTELMDAMNQSEVLQRFKAAESALEHNDVATRLLNDIGELQQKVRQQQFQGRIGESDLVALRALQYEIGTNDVIQEYLVAQQEMTEYLQTVNQEISQLIGIDFASFARRGGASC